MTTIPRGAAPESEALLSISGLVTDITLRRETVHAVQGVDLLVRPGETLGLVGESGCGKSMTALSIMGLLPPGGEVTGGEILFQGRSLLGLDDEGMRAIRGASIGMVFQDPLTSLNPTMTIGAQVAEAVRLHRPVSSRAARARAVEVLELTGIPRAAARVEDYPHQFSGGMRQRVMIAIALACEPRLLIADEPTTALDVTIQAQILDLIDRLRAELGMAVILVTHDLGVIAGRADRVAVMYAGRIVEESSADALFALPRHRYTEALLNALPEAAAGPRARLRNIPGLPPDLTRPQLGCPFAPRCAFADADCRASRPVLTEMAPAVRAACIHPNTGSPGTSLPREATRVHVVDQAEPIVSVRHLSKDYTTGRQLIGGRGLRVSAVSDVGFDVHRGETLGLVGESGCGKTTTGRMIVGLEKPTSGTVVVDGTDTDKMSRAARRDLHRTVQFMFQDPYSSLDPRMSVSAIIREPLQVQRVGHRSDRRDRVGELLDLVGLPSTAAKRFPHEFSGGQRQRIGLARALALDPALVVADEPVSALDVSIQAQVLNTMRDLQETLGLTYVLISHDLSVVRYLSDRIGVMYLGKLVELGPAAAVYASPEHPYTRALVDTVPVADPAIERAKVRVHLSGELPSATDPPSGCRFRTRCPQAQAICASQEPPLLQIRPGHQVACHFPLGGVATPPTGLHAAPPQRYPPASGQDQRELG